jgi:hypothetical protein
MGDVHNCDSYVNIPSSQTHISYYCIINRLNINDFSKSNSLHLCYIKHKLITHVFISYIIIVTRVSKQSGYFSTV